MKKNYPEKYESTLEMLQKLGGEIPQTMAGFSRLHAASTSEGALSKSSKELIALSIAVVVRCDGCIAYHVHDALEAGAAHEEIVEAIGVAIFMGGAPAVMYAIEALEALEQFQTLPAREELEVLAAA